MAEKINIKKIVGKNIKKYRELRGLTQEELIEKIDMGPCAISNIECGKSFPSISNLEKIIEVLKIEPKFLLEEKSIYNKEDILSDFKKRLALIKKDEEKFEILYSVIKAIS